MWSDQSNVLWRERSKGVVVLWEWVIDERFDFVCVCVCVCGWRDLLIFVGENKRHDFFLGGEGNVVGFQVIFETCQ